MTLIAEIEAPPKLVGRSHVDYDQELEDYLQKIHQKVVVAVITGTISGGGVSFASAGDVGGFSSEGTAETAARSDHTHGTVTDPFSLAIR